MVSLYCEISEFDYQKLVELAQAKGEDFEAFMRRLISEGLNNG